MTEPCFKKGDRVRMSAIGRARLQPRKTTCLTGKVVGFGRDKTSVIVLRDGVKYSACYHESFFEPDTL